MHKPYWNKEPICGIIYAKYYDTWRYKFKMFSISFDIRMVVQSILHITLNTF